jgi:alkylation response protein AidB-like acyl-CoA dehydrogenase
VIFAGRVLSEVIDRAVQVHGGLGLIDQRCWPASTLRAGVM